MQAWLGITPHLFILAAGITLVASFVKGAIGFAMPVVMISGLASIMPAGQALAALIVPTLVANLWQSLRGGGLAGVAHVVRTYRIFLSVMIAVIALAAQLFTRLPQQALFLVLGVPVIAFAGLQLTGWQPRIAPAHDRAAQAGFGLVAGISSGLTGVWGPPTVMYLAAIDAPKADAIRVQGVVFGVGAIMLVIAHLYSGVLNATTAPLSVSLVAPMLVGMALGQAVQDRMDQVRFRKAVLVVLMVVGVNLIRRGLTG